MSTPRFAPCLLASLWAALIPGLPGQVKITPSDGRVAVEIDGKPFTTLFHGPGEPKPYLHPLRAASGTIVSRSFPMENVEGEKRDHPHHRGLWFTHGDVNGWDFWANEKDQKGVGKGKGLVTTRKITAAKGGRKSGSVSGVFEWKDGNGTLLLTETRTMTFHAGGPDRVIDFDITLTAVEKSVFGDTKEGVFAIRLARELEEERTGTMLAAEGNSKEKNVWGKRSPWVDYSGSIQGEQLGIAILDHPGNPKHPTYWHSRAYGLFAANIFGEHDFYRDKSKNGGMTLEPGKSMRFRYRVVIHAGDTAAAGIAEKYKAFSAGK
ncbi:MAG: hypothetical protein FJW40_15730 [Acidobacteria bacterium]|nr:hypothetical protein [Acidobacteriota bacterium]